MDRSWLEGSTCEHHRICAIGGMRIFNIGERQPQFQGGAGPVVRRIIEAEAKVVKEKGKGCIVIRWEIIGR